MIQFLIYNFNLFVFLFMIGKAVFKIIFACVLAINYSLNMYV